MIRVLFGILAIIFVVLALFLDVSIWLLLLLVVAVAAAAAGTVMYMRQRRSDPEPSPTPEESQPDDLRSLGIMDIRPRERSQERREPEAKTRDSAGVSDLRSSDQPSPRIVKKKEPRPPVDKPRERAAQPTDVSRARPKAKPKQNKEEPTTKDASGREKPSPRKNNGKREKETPQLTPGERVLQPLLASMKEALDAHTVCLLKQEDLALEYYIEAFVSDEKPTRPDGRFVTPAPLLTATMAQRPVSIRHVGKSGVPRTSLGYYDEPVAVKQVAIAPVPRPNAMATHFIVADSLTKDALGSQFHRTVLAQYAEIIATLLDEIEDVSPPEPSDEAVRPRREIIAEEMGRAEEDEIPLALSLIHLNRAEVLADDGMGAVASAERALRRRLRHATPDGRVERFGELTFGIFQNRPLSEVERWATDLQRELDTETGILEGGISIGVAIMDARHDSPEAFRADATAALQESYQTGACIIVE